MKRLGMNGEGESGEKPANLGLPWKRGRLCVWHVCVCVALLACVVIDQLCVMTCEVRQSSAGRPRSDLSLEKKEDLEKRLESMSGCLTNRPRKTSAPGKGITMPPSSPWWWLSVNIARISVILLHIAAKCGLAVSVLRISLPGPPFFRGIFC